MSLFLALGLLLAMPAGAVDPDPDRGAPNLAAARAMVKEKRWSSAVAELTRLSMLAPSADVFNLLAFSQRNTGDYASALPNYLRALELDPDHRGAHEYLGELYLKTGERAKAQALLDRLVQLCPDGCEEREDLEAAMRAAR